uniref:Putative da-p36 protein n=1 Tax=Rhipicephalus pulchellus TaxID=72859 RepID=L7LR46_RHIPC
MHACYVTLVLSSVVNRGCSFRVNFTKVTERYIEQKNKTEGGKINSWGLTRDYAYWKQQIPSVQPVSAVVDWIIYGGCNKDMYRGPPKYNCSGFFSWSALDHIDCPFSIKHNTSLPIKYQLPKPKNISLDLNRLPAQHLIYHWGPPSRELEKKVFSPKCNFVAKITFDGYIVYNLTKPGSENWVPVKNTDLENRTEGLVVESGQLTFYMWGVYFETMWCYQ